MKYKEIANDKKRREQKRPTSFRLSTETLAMIHYIVETDRSHSMTTFIENHTQAFFNSVIKNDDISEVDALAIGFKRMFKSTEQKSDEEAKHSARVIRDMEIQRAKEEYQRRTGETDRELEESMRFGNMTLEEVLMAAGTLSRDYDK